MTAGRHAVLLSAALFCVAAAAGTPVRSEWLPEKFSAWSKSKRHSLIPREDGVTEFRHIGATEWTLDCFPRIPVRPGEPFSFTCRSEQVTAGAASRPFMMGAVLYGADGQVKNWSWGRVSVQPGDAGSTTFLVPNGVAFLQPRIFGAGNFAGAFPQLRFARAEDVEAVTRDAGLSPTLAIASGSLEVSFTTSNGVFSVTDRRTGRTWASTPDAQTAFRTIVIQSAIRKTMFAARFVDAEKLLRYTVVCRLEEDLPEFSVMLIADQGIKLGQDPLVFPPPFVSRKGDRVILPCGEGIGVPVDDRDVWLWRYAAFSGQDLSMPFFGVAEDSSGAGWMAVLETPDDAYAVCLRTGGKSLWTVGPGWVGQKGTFGYTRRVRYSFFDTGGHVAMASRYRRHAQERGLVKTLREKMTERPNVARLPGAAAVWYFPRKGDPDASGIAKELKAAGIGRFIWAQGGTERALKEIAHLDDVLVSASDGYRDVYHPEQLRRLGWTYGANREAWPADVNWAAPGGPSEWRRAKTVKAKDGATSHCAMMCDMAAPVHARSRIARELKSKPFTARSISSAASDPWQECFNPAHPTTRTDSRYWRTELLRVIGDEFRLVVGCEQGIDACVPHCDYMEGMLSLHAWRMPPGDPQPNFSQPDTPANVPAEKLAAVGRTGLSPALRLPLWELVYHDCCTATWHWQDASNWPLSLWKRRDLFNALYGTSGIFVFDGALWKKERGRFAASYGVWSDIARRTGFSRMVAHRILSPDRLVQQTAFSDGSTVTVNFGDAPFAMPDGRTVAPMSLLAD